MTMKPIRQLLCLIALLALVSPAFARVKLVALPDRARVVVSLSHPDVTLLEEERMLPLQKGGNQIDFSWRGVNIDANSIQIRLLTAPEQVNIINTSYPPNENALIWQVFSPVAKEERVRISYIIGGLTREVAYRAVSEPDEKSLALRNYLKLRNHSGEDIVDAEFGIGYGASFKKSIQHEESLELLSERIDALPKQGRRHF